MTVAYPAGAPVVVSVVTGSLLVSPRGCHEQRAGGVGRFASAASVGHHNGPPPAEDVPTPRTPARRRRGPGHAAGRRDVRAGVNAAGERRSPR
ncbi:hypothetical protein FTX61_19450 [Nitriliruptoraceae bacterium ZYF776]|nr:hypothetical protein [Profundirhabdus halotolerans]